MTLYCKVGSRRSLLAGAGELYQPSVALPLDQRPHKTHPMREAAPGTDANSSHGSSSATIARRQRLLSTVDRQTNGNIAKTTIQS
jgi:hypothetical protein